MNRATWEFNGEILELLPEKAVWWNSRKMLIIADLHVGKTSHFRKKGIPVPASAALHNLERLENLILSNKPQQVLFLGDLFHSSRNRETQMLQQVLDRHPGVVFHLVKGNHDAADNLILNNLHVTDTYVCDPFFFSHLPEDSGYYNLCGHLHPAIKLSGRGRQHLQVPCFHFGANRGVLPAFGTFTGTSPVALLEHEQVFGCTENAVIPLHTA